MKMLISALTALFALNAFASDAELSQMQEYDAQVMSDKIKQDPNLRSQILTNQLYALINANFPNITDSLNEEEIRESGLEDEYYFRQVTFNPQPDVKCIVDQRIRNLNRNHPDSKTQDIEVTSMADCTSTESNLSVEIPVSFLIQPLLSYPN